MPRIFGLPKTMRSSLSKSGRVSELVRCRMEPAEKSLGGVTGATATMRPFFSLRVTRSSSGSGSDCLLAALSDTLPPPGRSMPAPSPIAPVVIGSLKTISTSCSDPAGDRVMYIRQRSPPRLIPERKVARSAWAETLGKPVKRPMPRSKGAAHLPIENRRLGENRTFRPNCLL